MSDLQRLQLPAIIKQLRPVFDRSTNDPKTFKSKQIEAVNSMRPAKNGTSAAHLQAPSLKIEANQTHGRQACEYSRQEIP